MAAPDYRHRCDKGHLECDACGQCNGCPSESNYSGSFSGPNGMGKITTDSHGRTWHAECRYERTGGMA